MQLHARPIVLGLLALAFSLALEGCVNVPVLKPGQQASLDSALGLSRQTRTPELDAAWWQVFRVPELDALVRRALDANPSLMQAAARLDRATALAEAAGALGKPATGLGLDATRQRYSEHGLLPPPIAGSVRTNLNLQTGVVWEFDFFGRNQAQLRAALGVQRAAEVEAQAAAMALSSQVVRSYIGLARLLEQKMLLESQLRLRKQAADLVTQRVGAGLESIIEWQQAQLPLPELQRQLEAIDGQIRLARHQLAALCAQPMDAFDVLVAKLPSLPEPLRDIAKMDLALDLLGRRPDVVAARWRVEAATEDIAAARAQFYPNLNLSAFIGLNSVGLDKLLRAGSLQAGAGPALRLPIFDTGRLRAQLHGSVAELDAALASYNANVLQAVQESSDALSNVRSFAAQVDEQDKVLLHAGAMRGLAQQRVDAGLTNRLALINAELSLLNQQRVRSDVQAQWLDSHVTLIRALGGGWQPTPH